MALSETELQQTNLPALKPGHNPLDTPLVQLYRELLLPFVLPSSIEESAVVKRERIQTLVAEEDSPERQMAAKIVDYVYNEAYLKDGGNVVNIAQDALDDYPTTHTIVAVYDNNPTLVLGTLRVVCGNDLDLFNFFEIAGNGFWPHTAGRGPIGLPGEIGRFGLHPIFDLLRAVRNTTLTRTVVDISKRIILRELYSVGLSAMRDEGVAVPYFIAGPHVYRFLRRAGVDAIRLEKSIPSPSLEAARIRRQFSGYWQPDQSRKFQPAVYLAPWDLKPMEE